MFIKGNSFPALYDTIRGDPGALLKVDKEGSRQMLIASAINDFGEAPCRLPRESVPETLHVAAKFGVRPVLVADRADAGDLLCSPSSWRGGVFQQVPGEADLTLRPIITAVIVAAVGLAFKAVLGRRRLALAQH